MRSHYLRITSKAIFVLGVLLLTAGISLAQVTVTLTASRQIATLPDGNTVPMWGWTCDAASAATGNCVALNGSAQAGGAAWQPPLITVPLASGVTTGSLTINLTNNLPVESSVVIMGQVAGASQAANGGLGTPSREAGPRTDGAHSGQTSTTWTQVLGATFTPPAQGTRVRSFVSEIASGSAGSYSWTALKPGTYLIETGTYPSIQGPMGLYGVLVVYTPATGANAFGPGTAYTGTSTVGPYSINYDATVPLLLSEIDPVQNNAVDQFVVNSGGATCTPLTGGTCSAISQAAETMKWTQACGLAHTCYPAAVNYTPLYFLMNGVSFNKSAVASSAAPIAPAGTASTGNVLVRLVNAGSHMHVPSVNGLSMSLIAEDGNVLPDVALGAAKTTPNLAVRVQNEVFLAAGKVYDVVINPANNGTSTTAPTAFTAGTYQVFDRELSLSTNGSRDGGMQTILQVAGGALPASVAPTLGASGPTYYCVPGVTLNVSDTGKGVAGTDGNANVYGVTLAGNPANHTLVPFGSGAATDSLTLNPDGTFTYLQASTNATCGGSFTYYANNASGTTQTATIMPSALTTKPVANADNYVTNIQSLLRVGAPGVLANDTDSHNSPLCAAPTTATSCPATAQKLTSGGATLLLKPDGSFLASNAGGAGTFTFNYVAINAEKQVSNSATISVTFQAGSGLQVKVQDAGCLQTPPTATCSQITDYKWIIEQDLTFQIDPTKQVNKGGTTPPPTLGTDFHTSYMPVVAVGCTGAQSCERAQTVYDPTTGTHVPAVCDGGICVPASTLGASSLPVTMPGDVSLPSTDSFGRPAVYYISVLPADSANPFNTGTATDPTVSGNCNPGTTPTGQAVNSGCGHTMGGAPIAPGQTSVTVNVEPSPLPTATVTGFVFEDDWPLNGEIDTGGGLETGAVADAFPKHEPGLDDFSVFLWDDAGGSGDATGQMTYDMFNEPLTNALNGTLDPLTGLDACPISNASGAGQPIGVIIVCPRYESDGVTFSPLVGSFVVKNLMPGRFGIIVHPGARREANGENWLQTNTLDGTHFLDSFVKVAEPAYFQEYGPGGYHVFMGMANPQIINARQATDFPCGKTCNTVNVQVTNMHQDRPPSQQIYTSNVASFRNPLNYKPLSYTSCWAALGDTDGETFALQPCDSAGNVSFSNVPDGTFGLVVFDQWLDLIVDGSSKVINVNHAAACNTASSAGTCNVNYGAFTWQTHIWNRAYMDTTGKGRPDLLADGTLDPATSPGLIQVPFRIRMRNGKFNNTLFSTGAGEAHFDETFPLFNFYVVESDTTRFRGTGVHVVNDNGGALDTAGPYAAVLNSTETNSLPGALSVPGAVYCALGDAQCAGASIAGGAAPSKGVVGSATPVQSTGRIDPGSITTEAWEGGLGQINIIDWGKQPFMAGENGGIRGHVVYGSTRPFDDPGQLFQNLWEPLVPGVTINLYEEGTAADGTQTLTLVDSTTTSSWDAWAQGFGGTGNQGFGANAPAAGVPNMNCPGQSITDPFYGYTLQNTAYYLNPNTALPDNSQYKCYDGYHNLNEVQPAPYDGLYHFPSPFCTNNPGATFTVNLPSGSTQTVKCATVANPAFGVAGQTGAVPGILPSQATCQAQSLNCTGKYVVEAVTPPNYEIVKEEDKNILIGDNYIAPATQQFGAISNIFIVPDQATISNTNSCYGTGGGCTNPTTDLGRTFNVGGFGPGGLVVQPAPCVGQLRVVPDFMSISPESGEVAPFAGALRNLCDRKEVALNDQMESVADFFVWTKTPAASHYIGVITDDFSSEFDPAAPAFGEKFAVPNVPISIRDYNGTEISRVYSDQWGMFNGVVFSTWEVNPPNPTGYAPGMMITCMNDPGPILDTRLGSPTSGQLITDPQFNPNYSDFCYENPFMPADTDYLDTPVVPTAAFAEAYNPPDCAYPDATPAIKSVTGSVAGPYVSATGQNIIITALGDQLVPNNAYSGPAATSAPYNQKFITRHYGFGASRGSVTIGNVNATIVNWGDMSITATVPAGVPLCNSTNPAYMGANATARCGELVITSANGKKSVDTVTITVGGTVPKVVQSTCPSNQTFCSGQSIQSAIDSASPGDLIIVPPGNYNEMLLMWKPVRLQGVGAASVNVNANTHPAGKLLQPWRAKVNCLFGLALNGGFINNTNNQTGSASAPNPFDPGTTPAFPNLFPSSNNSTSTECPFYQGGDLVEGSPHQLQSIVDPLPLEPVIAWDATLNGNIAELLQEPTLMGAYEGAAITVLGKGIRDNNTSTCDPTTATCTPLNACPAYAINFLGFNLCFPVAIGPNPQIGDCNPQSSLYGSNYLCNPSRIDGMSFTNSSQGGGGIFVHGWTHNLELSNDRVYNNGGTITGGILVGQPETPPLNVVTVGPTSVAEPLLLTHHVNVHNNYIVGNTSYGDELNSTTPASAGGVSFCTGSDYYKFNNNWVCGNLSSGDGGGVAHNGFIYYGDIEHNAILFNQSTNPTLPTHGGGLIIEGEAPDGGACEIDTVPDFDCPPDLADGAGPGTIVNANLIMGNTAESGNGGGLRLQQINGNDVALNYTASPGRNHGLGSCTATSGYVGGRIGDIEGLPVFVPGFSAGRCNVFQVNMTNNIIANNVAGWTGGGASIQDAIASNFINNTVISNDTTASAGVLFNTGGAANSSNPPPGCNPQTGAGCNNIPTTTGPEPAGLVTEPLSILLRTLNNPTGGTAFTTCPTGNAGNPWSYPNCAGASGYSNPVLDNNLFWQNRPFHITVPTPGTVGANTQTQSFVTIAPTVIQTSTGACGSGASYWDIGVLGDTSPTTHVGGTLRPMYSILSSGSYAGNGNQFPSPNTPGQGSGVVHQYCNGSRVPPEIAPQVCTGATPGANAPGCILGGAIGVPPGVPDASNSTPPFGFTPAGTVDEGNNWINLFYGPLSMFNPTITSGGAGYGEALGNYSLAAANNGVPNTSPTYPLVPPTDFFGNRRSLDGHSSAAFDIGAVEFATTASSSNGGASFSVLPNPLNFGNVAVSSPTTLTVDVNNTGDTVLAVSAPTIAGAGFTIASNSCAANLGLNASCTIGVTFAPGAAAGTYNGTLTVTLGGVSQQVALTGTAWTPVTATAALNLGTVSPGATSAPGTVTLTNPAGNPTLQIGTITFSSGDFYQAGPAGGTGGTCGSSLAAGASCTINVVFTGPNTAGAVGVVVNGTMNINDTAANSPQVVNLSGTY
jgi:hypothetical protein